MSTYPNPDRLPTTIPVREQYAILVNENRGMTVILSDAGRWERYDLDGLVAQGETSDPLSFSLRIGANGYVEWEA